MTSSQALKRQKKSFGTLLSTYLPRLSERGLVWVLGWASVMSVLSLLQVLMAYQRWEGGDIITWVLVGLAILMAAAVLIELGGLWYLVTTAFLDRLYVERKLNHNLPVNKASTVQIILANHSEIIPANWLQLAVMDVVPASCHIENLPQWIAASLLKTDQADTVNKTGVLLDYALTPTRRGLGQFDGVHLCLQGRFGWWQLQYCIPESQVLGSHEVRIFADFKTVLSGNLFAHAQKSAIDGGHIRRRRGQGQDFYQIRGYSEGDSIRHIDWRATSRLGRLMTKEYQDEQEQEILFLLDCSQQMRHERLVEVEGRQGVYSHLDTVLNAMLLIANSANQQGDATGFVSFSGINDKIAPAKKGAGLINYLLNQSFDIHASMHMPDYIAAARIALMLQKKRSLIILLTSTRTEEFDELISAVNLLRAKHLVIVANIYEQDLFDRVYGKPPSTGTQAKLYHSVKEHLNCQQQLNSRLSAMAHVYPIWCTPDTLPTMLLHGYFAIKRAQKF